MNWLLAVSDVPGGGFDRPDLPPGTGKMVVLGILALTFWVVKQTGAVSPERLLDWLQNRSPTFRLRRSAYGVASRVFSMSPVGVDKDDRYTRNAHRRETVPDLKRSGRHCVYAEVHYKKGVDTGPGSKLRLAFESVWRQEMTRPDKHGNAAHDWEFKWYIGSPVVVCRIAPLPDPGVIRLFEHLQPILKWPEGTQPAEVITAVSSQVNGKMDP